MCGIYGHLELSGQTAFVECLPDALTTLTHRGPDERGSWHNLTVALGMCRLSIIDLAGGQQPIWNEDQSCCIVYNGELYNFLDLRPVLEAKGHCFRTRSDTEVILHAYEEWGVNCLHRLNGMFALAIWDEKTQSLFLARDRIGEKPLYYYYQSNQCLVFASEIKALLADPAVPRAINPQGLANFLTFGHAVAPETIYQQIYKLLPGHYLLLCNGQIQLQQYWDVGTDPQLPPNVMLREAEYATQILALLDDSVRRRMVADVPVGAFLSGGVDSSAVVALMKRHTNRPVKTFSLGFDLGDAYNELDDARQVAHQLGTEHHEFRLQPTDLVDSLCTLVYHYDEPFGDPAGFPIYLLSRYAREHVKVVLTGDGGDELFGGYRRYVAEQAAALYQRLPKPTTEKWVPHLASLLPRARGLKRLAHTFAVPDPAHRYAAWLALFTREMRADILSAELNRTLAGFDPTTFYSRYYHQFTSGVAGDHLNRIMYVDLKLGLVDAYMEKTDKMAMACSLETRLPLLDYRLVELAFQIPARYKVKYLETKSIFKTAIRSLVPDFVLHKPKHGFTVPTDPWFRGELKHYAYEILLDPRARRRGYLNLKFVEKLWREHLDGRHNWDAQLWLLLNFELWCRVYLDQEA